MIIDCRESGADCRKYRPYLDGFELFHCFYADDEKGVAYIFVWDEMGYLHRGTGADPHEDNVVEVHGKIEFKLAKEVKTSRLRQREGDQPIPTPGQEDVAPVLEGDIKQLVEFNGKGSEVITDLHDRTALGIKRYGTPLQTFNGRDALQDLYEELLDASQYCEQLWMETRYPRYRTILWVLIGYLIDLRTEKV